ncbi:DUF1963 domain-containing protein [Dactylosporangium sp. CA-233914]|uniref:DUF1963 domain-containing protein n=1 Tax=Dactylosporangium sp. CA-233914 TaxID=3239934 RepID=UPI003D8B640B
MERGIPADAVDGFAEQLRFSIWASAGGDGELVGRSGGLPRLPVGMDWPSTTACRSADAPPMPLPFIASFDCAALPRIGGFDLPAEGSLLFFLDHEADFDDCDCSDEEQPFARVLYVPAGTDTTPPDGPPEETLAYEEPFLRPEQDLFATVRPVVPPWLTCDEESMGYVSAIQEWISPLTHTDELVAVVEELWPSPGSDTGFCRVGYPTSLGSVDTPDFLIGGYSLELDSGVTPEYHIAADDVTARQESGELDVTPAERDQLVATENPRIIREWVPLAQFATSHDLYYGCFMIRWDDLAAGRFDRALSFTMFSG